MIALPVLTLGAQSCTENVVNEGDVHNHYSFGGDGGAAEGGAPGTGGQANDGYTSHLPTCSTRVPLEQLDIDLFGKDGHLFYFEVTPEARQSGDERACDGGIGGPIFDDPVFDKAIGGGVYNLGDRGGCPIPAFNVRIVPRDSEVCSDTGKVELELPGQSSFKPWLEIPNFKLDVGEFRDQKFPSGDRTLRMNNGQADSTIVREATALRIWRAMGYPAPKTRFVKTQSNVWDTEVKPGVFAAHVMVQPYKEAFFAQNLADVGNVWEGAGDPFSEFGFTPECQWSRETECEDDLLMGILETVVAAPQGDGFMAATAEVIDWPRLFENQCLAALTGTGDDWIHNTNNVVIALEDSGKILFLPYSTDISGGHPWYQSTPYDGSASLTQRCAADSACRTQALDTCDAMIDTFEALHVSESIVAERCGALTKAGLERDADADVCASLKKFYDARPNELRDELQMLRDQQSGQGGAGGDTGVGGGIVFPL